MNIERKRSLRARINRLFLMAVSLAFVVTLVSAVLLLRVDARNNEYRGMERVKAMLDAQLPLLGSDLHNGNLTLMRTRLKVMVATNSELGFEAAVWGADGKLLDASDGIAAILPVGKVPASGAWMTPDGYAVSVRSVRSGFDTLGYAAFILRLPAVSSKVIGQSLVASLAVLLGVLCALFLATRHYLMALVVRPISELIGKLPALSRYVKTETAPPPPVPDYSSRELRALARALWETHDQLKETMTKERELRLEAAQRDALVALSSQVAHDIRSPLAALDIVVDSLPDMEQTKRLLIQRAVARIHEIANNLLRSGRETVDGATPQPEPLVPLVDAITAERRAAFVQRAGVTLTTRYGEAAATLFARVNAEELRRVLTNLINNAAEAIEETGSVTVELMRGANEALVRIVDDGRGIPPEVLARLGRPGVTHGKPSGSGLGIAHAKATLERWGGRLEIRSVQDKGTIVSVILPAAAPPLWYAERVQLPTSGRVVVIDDDPCFHDVWKRRFEGMNLPSHGIEVAHFGSPEAYRRAGDPHADLLLVDYEFFGIAETGLDLVEHEGLAARAILVTNRDEEPGVRRRCEALGVRLLPKSVAPLLPVQIG